MISPSATYVGLTHHGPATTPKEPGRYRALGAPIFRRVVAADDAQGAANAVLAKHFGLHSLFLLEDGSHYGRGLVAAVTETAKRLGIHILGVAQWDPLPYSAAAAAAAETMLAAIARSNGTRASVRQNLRACRVQRDPRQLPIRPKR